MLQVQFGKTILASVMRVSYNLPKKLVWGQWLGKCWQKAYVMAEVTLPHMNHFVFTSQPSDLDYYHRMTPSHFSRQSHNTIEQNF